MERPAGGGECRDFCWGRFEKNDVEDDIVELKIGVVAVIVPIARMKMDFDVSNQAAVCHFDFSIEEVGSLLQIPLSDSNYFEGFAIGGGQFFYVKIAAHPDFLQESFGHGNGSVKTLNLLKFDRFHSIPANLFVIGGYAWQVLPTGGACRRAPNFRGRRELGYGRRGRLRFRAPCYRP